MESSKRNNGKKKHLKQYFRLTITYTDGETSGRVFTSREHADKYAARQSRSPVVKKTEVEAFIKDRLAWIKRRKNRKNKTNKLKK
jgi:hypothetical protein